MNIVYVTRELPPSLRCGGIGSYVWDISRAIAQRGHKVTVICSSDDTKLSEDSLSEGVRIIRLSGGDFAIRGVEVAGDTVFGRNWRVLTRYWSYRKKVADCLENINDMEKVDIIEFAEYGNEAAGWFKRNINIPSVVRLHTPSAFDRNTATRIKPKLKNLPVYFRALKEYDLLKSATAITSCSKALADWIKQDAGLLREIKIIPNPVISSEWSVENSSELKKSADQIEILYVGSIVPAKGIYELIQSVTILRKKGIKLKLTLIGKLGAAENKLESVIKTNSGLSEWLNIIHHLQRMQLRDYYKNATITCFPSWWDNFPIVCLEAMAAGALVLGSSSGGMTEIIQDGIDGYLVEPKDPLRLATKIENIIGKSSDDLLLVRRAAKKKVIKFFDMEVVIPEMLSFYENVISGKFRS